MALGVDHREISRRFALAVEYLEHVEANEGVDPQSWLGLFDRAKVQDRVALKYALAHPRVCPLAPDRWAFRRGGRDFLPRPRVGRSCWAPQIWGYRCPCGSSTLQLDHAWPFALGGMSVPENAIWLCTIHNRAKSDDVHLYDWPESEGPSWLQLFLTHIWQDLRAPPGLTRPARP